MFDLVEANNERTYKLCFDKNVNSYGLLEFRVCGQYVRFC